MHTTILALMFATAVLGALKPLCVFTVAKRMTWLAGFLTLLLSTALVLAFLSQPMDPALRPWLTIATIAAATFGSAIPAATIGALPQTDAQKGPRLNLPSSYAIGLAERFAFTTALAMDMTEVGAVIIGVKALGQYQSDDNTLQSHRVLGTLSSVGWSLTAFAVLAVLTP